MSARDDSPEITSASVTGVTLTVSVANRKLQGYTVSEHELDQLKACGASNNLALFGISVGVLVTATATLATVTIDDAKVFGAFMGVAVFFIVLTIAFGTGAWRDRGEAERMVKRIRGET